MAQLNIDTAAVAQSAAALGAAASSSSSGAVCINAPAADPVSVAVAETLQARSTAIMAYSSMAEGVTQARGQMLASSAATYDEQEQLNAATLRSDAGASAAGAPPPVAMPALPVPTAPAVTAPQIGSPPSNGKEVAALIHGGPGPAGLYSAAQQLRSHAEQLHSTARRLQGRGADLPNDWRSGAADQASARIKELGQWYERHAEQASAAAGAMETHADTYARARSNIPTPSQFQDTENRLKQANAANANPANLGRYAAVVSALQTELASLHTKAAAQYADYARSAAHPGVVGDPLEAPPQPGQGTTQALDAPLSPSKDEERKWWLDLDKIEVLDPEALGPSNYRELIPGSGIWYPENPSGPAQSPVDLDDIVHLHPDDLGPSTHRELFPNSGTWVPEPNPYPGSTEKPPSTPIDIRDLIAVPEGELAPAGTVQIAPGLWYPVSPRIPTLPSY